MRGYDPCKGQNIFIFPRCSEKPWGPINLPFNGYLSSAPVIRQQVPEFGNSPISRGKVKNEWSSDSMPSRRGQVQLCLSHLCPTDLTLYTLSYWISIPMWGKSILTKTTSIQTPTNTRLLSDGLKWPQRDG